MAVLIYRSLPSTNTEVKKPGYRHGDAVIAKEQTAGRGQRGNRWSSNPGENLTFSLVWEPTFLEAKRQFLLSEAVALALTDTLGEYNIKAKIKWTNDIYVGRKKICGILIEHDIEGTHLSRSIIGVGLNVNQAEFVSDAPNPISLLQILGHEIEREALLDEIVAHFYKLYTQYTAPSPTLDRNTLHTRYTMQLYRKDSLATYRDAEGPFIATLRDVAPDGRLLLEDQQGTLRSYLFKEVTYVI
jgi:BirA family biotin operon repressor/biotin-[acetyl-CoA-carboxylase] ligase